MNTFPTLDAWLAHLEAAHPVGIDMGLARIGKVKDALGLRFDCPVITVGGTNGKGSTCAIIETILLRAGYRVGCHTSPHLLSFNERARIDGADASDADLLEHFAAVEKARASRSEPVSLTYFEFTTLAILHLFASRGLDAVILEVGLGGRLDAVNIVDTDCAVITSIDIDHTDFLGDTREKIGFEKAGIFRAGKPAVCGDPSPPQSLIDHAEAIGADLWLVGRDFRYEAQPGNERQQWSYIGRAQRRSALAYPALRGANQLINTSAALAALESLRDRLPVSAQDIRLGLANVELPGRFQVLPGKPQIILDVAHNPHAAAVLAQNLGNMGYFPYTYAVFGAMRDKDIEGVLKQLKGEIDHWNVTALPTPRAASAEQLEHALRDSGVNDSADSSVSRFETPAAAFQDALSRASENDRILVFGSFYTVAGVMAYRRMQHN
ncbi:bifunctional tetrahydrofolate synthase/dihydrofolate synthase [Caballeronia sp. J97]|uniref:bifunctional tetrahydrofolate synthase/dihydrofolate synthase n=1 Tax=Caballeronia sp. J97 TaxID=2805429 RepID=UPI002AB1DCB4|nr:bifunctional tetrahydrofolate synthase/dihydrofolate synthase [Caballeronia sp. J97]